MDDVIRIQTIHREWSSIIAECDRLDRWADAIEANTAAGHPPTMLDLALFDGLSCDRCNPYNWQMEATNPEQEI